MPNRLARSHQYEWHTLADFLGGQAIAGGPLKETGTTHWNEPNTGATNETGFTAFPTGYRYDGTGAFTTVGGYTSWYTSTEFTDPLRAYQWWSSYNDTNCAESSVPKAYGSPTRCIKDN